MTKKAEVEEKAMVEKGSSDIVEHSLVDSGLECVEAGDMKISMLRLVQSQSKKGTPGMIMDTITNEEFESVTVILLAFKKGRVMFDKDLTNNEPLCRSNDGQVPTPNIENPMGTDCKTCIYSKWEGRTPPPCSDTYTFMVIQENEAIPAFMQLKGMSIAPTKKLLSALVKRAKVTGDGIWRAKVEIKSVPKQTKEGLAYIAEYSPIEWLEDDEYLTVREEFLQTDIDEVYDAEANKNEANDEEEEMPI